MARPNEAVVRLPNGTWAPSVICKPVQTHATFTLPALRSLTEGGSRSTFPRVCACVCLSLFACCENPVTALLWNMASCTRPGWAVSGQEKACHCLRATVPRCGPNRECDICLCGRDCGVGVCSCSSTAGAGLSGFSSGSTSWLLRLLHCHGPKAGLTTVNLGFI